MKLKRLRAAAVATAAAAVAVSGLAAGAQSASAVVPFLKLEALHSGKVLDVRSASTSANAHVIRFPFIEGDNQQWRRINVAAPSSNSVTPDFLLQNRNSGMCLDVEGQSKAAGAHLVQQPCDLDGGKLSQRWFMHKVVDKGLLTGKVLPLGVQPQQRHGDRHCGRLDCERGARGAILQKGLGDSDNQMFNFGLGGVG